ncbi:hypothetical protein GCM10022280_18980 [Sphingomonas swuensis]|uniref:MobA/MobL protein domain-containing protein n=1 Tax=Sphingomonas swuensis TaxID=977800 RepID=A0ABP7T0T0_9SPHN
MATSSISADVTAANSKIAEFLRRQEEEEMILQIGKRKPKQAREERLPGGSGRWRLEPDWKAPTPMVDRPRTTTGATSFHFSYSSISRQAVPTVSGQPVSGHLGKVRNPALDHSKYIERDGAAEHSQRVEHAAYIERDGAAEMLDPSALMSEAMERTIAAVVNETPTTEEAAYLGLADVAPEGIPSVFSNISDDLFERQEFWRAVERCEANPRSHQIILEPDICPAWWRELETTTKLDPESKSHALQVAEAYRQHMAKPLAEGEVRKPFTAKPMSASAEKAGAFIQQAQRMAAYNDAQPPFEFKSGRGGRIQFRMVAELPHELSAEDRALIVQNFCDHLASLEERREPDGTAYKTGLMYTAVIHAPDAHNDSRNYHLHVVAYDRPCRFIPERNQWDFEIPVVYVDPGSRKERTHYPYRQNKIGEVSQGTEKTGKEKSGKDFIPGLRAKFAEINNVVLKARGINRRLDPRKYTEMGIDRTPTQHLGTKAAALESIGVPTAVGQLNAIAIWSDAERAITRQATQAGKAYQATQSELDGIAKGMAASDPDHPAMMQFRSLTAERERLIKDVADDRQAIMTFDHLEAKAKSRAIRTRQTCLTFLSDIETGKADRNTKAMRLVIEDRWRNAQAHIAKIDNALQPHREALTKAARDIEMRERRILEIDTALEPVRAVLEKRLAEHGHYVRPTKLKASEAAQKPAAPASTLTPPAAEPKVPDTGRAQGSSAEPEATATPAPAAPARTATTTPTDPSAEAEVVASAEPEVTPAVPPMEPAQASAEPTAAEPDVGENEIAQSTDPVSISGLPIVEPTIAPRQDIPAEEVEIEAGTPEGLDPLRPAEVVEPVAAEPEVILVDIDNPAVELTEAAAEPTIEQPAAAAEVAPHDAEPAIPASTQDAQPTAIDTPAAAEPATAPAAVEAAAPTEPAPAAESHTSGPTPPIAEPTPVASPDQQPEAPAEPKVDGRKKVQDPTLFDLPAQEPPVKPGTSRAAYVDFDTIIKRVMDDRIPIVPEKQANGRLIFTVPSLPPEQQETLNSPKFAHRTNQRLGAIMDKQKQEVQRAVRWIATQGQNPDNLSLKNKTASLGTGVKVSVRTLFRHWGKHPEVTAALRTEYDRRVELEKNQPVAKPEPAKAESDLSERRAEAERIYPDPSQAFTPEVAEFTRLLRELAPADQLRLAADKIYENPRAREDIHKHTVYLATAYHTHVEGHDQRLAERQLREMRGKCR